MKINRLLPLVLVLAMMLTACGALNTADDGRLDIVTTNYAMYDLARAVAGDLCDVTMLIPPGAESHDFEAALADIAVISEADVFVHVGSEDWVEDIFSSMGDLADDIAVVNALEVVEEKGTDIVFEDGVGIVSDESEHEHEHEHDHEPDEHCWMSIGNAKAIIEEITEAIISADQKLFDETSANRDLYISRLEAIDEEFYTLLNNSARRKIVVADRFPFAYMTARYGIEYEAAFSGCTSDTEPSLAVINSLIEAVKHDGITAIFVTEDSDRKTAEAIAAETGAEILTLYSAQSVTKADFENGTTFADYMEKNLAALKTALGAEN